MADKVYNCIICAQEMSEEELNKISSLKFNLSNFKVCQSCLNRCDPKSDYLEAKKIIASYLLQKETTTPQIIQTTNKKVS